ncbi:MAG: 6-phosphogluconolactonase, partial [Dysgonamonadaceae bacterium]
MRLDLSSNITFERVPQKLYRPENDFEEYSLTRYEKVPTLIYENISRASRKVAREIVKDLQKKQQTGENFVLGLSDGSSPVSVYEELIRMHKEEGVSFNNLVVFNTYEFYPIVDVTSCIQSIKEVFLNQIDIDPANI